MSNFSKIVIVILVVLSFLFIREKYGSNISSFVSSVVNMQGITIPFNKNQEKIFSPEIIEPPQAVPVRQASDIDMPPVPDGNLTADIFFLALDNNNNSIYKKVQRKVPVNEDKLEFSIKSLLKGPTMLEKSFGAYSEIPSSTRLAGIKQTPNKVIIDFSSDFGYGGGTDSIYSRMMQLIKTSVANTDGKEIYLYLDGKQINMIGGEGIMISQPLSEKSLEI